MHKATLLLNSRFSFGSNFYSDLIKDLSQPEMKLKIPVPVEPEVQNKILL
jgi:hypothetical protein